MIRVEVPDAASAKGLVQRLAGVFEPTSVLLDADRAEVRVEEKRKSSRTVAQVLATVEDWLAEAGADCATVWLDGSRYTLAPRPRADRERPVSRHARRESRDPMAETV
jgi:hypothetical protein